MTAVVLALIAAVATILAATLPALLKSKGAGEDTLAAVLRLETKVDALHDNVVDLIAWKNGHEADHAPSGLVPVPRTIRRARG
jgi:hypothetical protein